MPEAIGDWQLVANDQLDANAQNILRCSGALIREYAHRNTHATVKVAVLMGPVGPISVHTPEVCYSSRAYSTAGPREAVQVESSQGRANRFWALTLHSDASTADRLRVYYGWSTGDQWLASESPRFEFAGRPWLYKVQLASVLTPGISYDGEDPCYDFLKALLESGWSLRAT
jgi:hypothetical protein